MPHDRHAPELEPRDHVDHRFCEGFDAVRVARRRRLLALAEARQIWSEHAKALGERLEHALEFEVAHQEIVDQEYRPAASRLDDAHANPPRRHVPRHPVDHRPRTLPKPAREPEKKRICRDFAWFSAGWTHLGPKCG